MAGSKLGARKQPAAAPSKSGEASKPTPGNSATRDLDADMDSEDSNDTDEEAMHLDEQPGQKGSKRKVRAKGRACLWYSMQPRVVGPACSVESAAALPSIRPTAPSQDSRAQIRGLCAHWQAAWQARTPGHAC